MSRTVQLARYGELDPGRGYGKEFSFSSNGAIDTNMDGGTVANTGAAGTVTWSFTMAALVGRAVAIARTAPFTIELTPYAGDTIKGLSSYSMVTGTILFLTCYVDGTWEIPFGDQPDVDGGTP